MTSSQLATSFFFLMQVVCNLWALGCAWPAAATYLSSWLPSGGLEQQEFLPAYMHNKSISVYSIRFTAHGQAAALLCCCICFTCMTRGAGPGALKCFRKRQYLLLEHLRCKSNTGEHRQWDLLGREKKKQKPNQNRHSLLWKGWGMSLREQAIGQKAQSSCHTDVSSLNIHYQTGDDKGFLKKEGSVS